MKDIANRFSNNPLLKPSDLNSSSEGLEIVCLLNPGVFRFDNKIWMIIWVAERPIQKENTLSFPVLNDKGVQLIEIALNDSDLNF